jgi:tripartite-type tricarboxylate transporter receptor subunit TctC
MMFAPVWLATIIGLTPTAADAQQPYPTRPVRIVVASSPGGGTDTVGRLLANEFSRSLQTSFIVENKSGAGNVIGTQAVASSLPDGYTLLVTASTLTINHVMNRQLPYDAVRDLTPISQVVIVPNVLVINATMPQKSVADLISYAKAHPGELNYASAGVGTNPHFAMELMKGMAGFDIRHVPYRGVAPALSDLIAGRVSVMIVNLISAKPYLDAGNLRALAVSGLERVDTIADIPTIAEAGVPGYEALQWFGLLAPAGTPREIVDLLQRETRKAMARPEVAQRLASEGAVPVASSPDAFAALIADERKKWSDVAKTANIQPEQ